MILLGSAEKRSLYTLLPQSREGYFARVARTPLNQAGNLSIRQRRGGTTRLIPWAQPRDVEVLNILTLIRVCQVLPTCVPKAICTFYNVRADDRSSLRPPALFSNSITPGRAATSEIIITTSNFCPG